MTPVRIRLFPKAFVFSDPCFSLSLSLPTRVLEKRNTEKRKQHKFSETAAYIYGIQVCALGKSTLTLLREIAAKTFYLKAAAVVYKPRWHGYSATLYHGELDECVNDRLADPRCLASGWDFSSFPRAELWALAAALAIENRCCGRVFPILVLLPFLGARHVCVRSGFFEAG